MRSIKKWLPINMVVLLTISVFFVLILSMFVAALIVYLLMGVGLLRDLSELNLIKSFMLLVVISTIVGTLLTSAIGRAILDPFRVLSVAMKKLAAGDFSVRIDLSNRFVSSEFDELTASFNTMAEQLGSVEMLRSDFVNNFSHEFKTPIVSLRGFAKILKKKNLTEAERREYLDIIISEADRLAALSQNVLSLSKIENQTIITDNIIYNLTEQVRCAILLLESKWSHKHIELDLDLEEIKFNGNEELLNMVWINLIDNAIKFSDEKGKIIIRLSANGDDVVFEIRDFGQGMDEETQKNIFDKFYQGDTSHSVEGNGIGMTIVRKIVELYNGEIFIDSKLKQGTSIILTLPNRHLA